MSRLLTTFVIGLGLWTMAAQLCVLIGARLVDLLVVFAVLVTGTVLVAWRKGIEFFPGEPREAPLDRRIVVATVLAATALAWMLRGPSPDDTVYGNLAVTVADHPFEPLLRRDGLFGLDSPSPMLRPYSFHGVEPLAGALAWLTGIDALTILHVGLPLLFGTTVALVQFELGRVLLPAHRHAVGIGALVVLLLVADGWQSHGSHGFAASAMGRALLVNGLLPMVFLATLRLHAVKGAAAVLGLMLTLFAASGASSNGLVLGPLCVLLTHLGITGVRGAAAEDAPRVLLALAPVVFIATWAFAYRSALHPMAPTNGPDAMREVIERAFGGTWAVVVTVLGIAGGIAATPRGPHRRALLMTAAVLLVLLVNPWIPGLLNRLVVREGLLPRLALLLPTPALMATAAVGLVARTRLPARGASVIGVVALAAILSGLPLRGVVDDPWDPDPVRASNVYPATYQTALRLASITDADDLVLVPQWASIYVPTLHGHPQLFYARELYEGYLADRLGAPEAERRRRLALFVEGSERVDDFEPTCEDFDGIDVILTRPEAARARALLLACRWSLAPDTPGQDLWMRR